MSPSAVTVISVVASMLTAFGVSGLLVAFFQHRFEHQKQVRGQEHDLKERRYKTILLLMLTQLDPEDLRQIREHRSDLRDITDVKRELRTEMLNSILFAGDDVVRRMAEFIKRPTCGSYVKTAASMRRDLWGRGATIDESVLALIA